MARVFVAPVILTGGFLFAGGFGFTILFVADFGGIFFLPVLAGPPEADPILRVAGILGLSW